MPALGRHLRSWLAMSSRKAELLHVLLILSICLFVFFVCSEAEVFVVGF